MLLNFRWHLNNVQIRDWIAKISPASCCSLQLDLPDQHYWLSRTILCRSLTQPLRDTEAVKGSSVTPVIPQMFSLNWNQANSNSIQFTLARRGKTVCIHQTHTSLTCKYRWSTRPRTQFRLPHRHCDPSGLQQSLCHQFKIGGMVWKG